MNYSTTVRRMAGLAAAIALAAGASVGFAQPEDDFDQPLNSQRSSVTSRMMLSESDGVHTYTLRIEDDKISAEVDGERVPPDRIRKRGQRYEILDENGDVIKTFNVRTPSARDGQNFITVTPRFRVEPLRPSTRNNWDPDQAPMEQPPKVMIGITMSDTEEGGVSVESVIDGLPAAKAGIKPGDRILEARGRKIESAADLREALSKAEPGDIVALRINRDGEEIEVKVKLAKWDEEKLGLLGMEANPLAAITGRGDHLDAARKSLEKALETVRRNTRLTGVDREAVDKAIQDALKSLEQARKIGVVRFGDFLNDDGIRVFGEGRTFTIPVPSVPPVAVDEDLSRQLKRLNEQIEKLNRRIEQLEKER